MTENSISVYGTNWDRFYGHLTKSNTDSLWDVRPEQSIEIDYHIFKEHFDDNLPVVDFGCGTGIQASFLTQHYPKVLGLDTSRIVIENNKSSIKIKNISFDVFDGLDLSMAQRFHNELGDANIYIRGVLHQLKENDRFRILKSIKAMMGRKGTLYLLEVLPEIRHYLKERAKKFSALPLQMKAVFMGNLPPIGLDPDQVTALFPKDEFELIHKGKADIATLLQFDSGEFIKIPAAFYIIKNKDLE